MGVRNIEFDDAFSRSAAENTTALKSFQRFSYLITQLVSRADELLHAGIRYDPTQALGLA